MLKGLAAIAFLTLMNLGICWLAPVEAEKSYPCQGAGQHRNKSAVRQFMKAHPCPAGPDKGSTKRCRGWQVDHVCPLACCGLDAPQNMQWLTAAANSKKGADCTECGLGVSTK